MKIETREIYKYECCNKLYQIKSFAAKHEISCGNNPNNYRDCLNAIYSINQVASKKNLLIEVFFI